jgi:hypothetical protein
MEFLVFRFSLTYFPKSLVQRLFDEKRDALLVEAHPLPDREAAMVVELLLALAMVKLRGEVVVVLLF